MVERKRCPPGCDRSRQPLSCFAHGGTTDLDELGARREEGARVVDVLDDLHRAHDVIPGSVLREGLGRRVRVGWAEGVVRVERDVVVCDGDVRFGGVDSEGACAQEET